uniref:Uncharacterized protein n=1 Tax=Arundo donax TaxID=35708 RepID=A0A0A9FK22_ARUDO
MFPNLMQCIFLFLLLPVEVHFSVIRICLLHGPQLPI